MSNDLANNGQNRPPLVPWKAVQSRFFPNFAIDGSRWDQFYPYRLVVVDTQKGNAVVTGTGADASSLLGGDNAARFQIGSGATVITYRPIDQSWIFQLPISPEQLKITDQYSISTSATLRGVMEEHNGVKFKTIMAAGTFGVMPYRETPEKPPGTPTIGQSVFGGTIQAANNLDASVRSAVASATNAASNRKSVRPDDTDTVKLTKTGYYHALALTLFLEQYAEAKKDPKNAGWRLVFDIPKQGQSFVVTPMQFEWSQSAQQTMAINYSMQFKAWKRIPLNTPIDHTDEAIDKIGPGILQRVLNSIAKARAVMSSSLNLLKAVRSDVEAPLDALRQTALFVKDLAGVIITAADLPFQIQKDYKSAIASVINTLDINNLTVQGPGLASVSQGIKDIQGQFKTSEGLSFNAVSSGQLGSQAAAAQSVNPASNPLSSPQGSFGLIDQVPVTAMALTSAQRAQVDTVVQQARATTVDDLKKYRATILELSLQLSNSFGAGSTFFSKTYGKQAPAARTQPMTLEEFDILKVLYDVVQGYDLLTATNDIDRNNKIDSIAFVSGLASDANVKFSIPNSKIQVPVPFNMSIEQIAAKYLNDAQRWVEIATLNNLRTPYIDENGFQLPLLSNASGRQVSVSSADSLFIGQRVIVKSSMLPPVPRVILNIDKLSSTSFLLTLDGPANLDSYTLSSKAFLQAYLPGTVNSQQKIFLPSDVSLPTQPDITVPASTSGDPLTGVSKVDLLLTDSGDLAVNTFGDFRFSSGITNLIQAIKIKLGTQKGSLLLHPDFGLGIRPGQANSAIQVQDIYKGINTLIAQDSRFDGLSNLQILLNGPTLSINMDVKYANGRGAFPLSFTLT